MRRSAPFAALALLLLVSYPAAAQVRIADLTAWGSFAHVTKDTEVDPVYGFDIAFENGAGFGLSTRVTLSPLFALSVGGQLLKVRGNLRYQRQDTIDLGGLDMIPLTLGLEVHPISGGPADPYLTLGCGYALFGNFSSRDLNSSGQGTVEVDGTFVLHGGLGLALRVSDRVAVVLESQYLRLKPESKGKSGSTVDLKLDTVTASLGLRYSFR